MKKKLMDRAEEIFKEYLIKDKDWDGKIISYLNEDKLLWEGEENFSTLQEFVDFLIIITTCNDRKILEFMNYISEKIPEEKV